ncbi:MAG TPA: flagellar motor switch protein FliG [Bryobacteraceae bacterium]
MEVIASEDSLTGLQKAAIILIALGPTDSVPILKHLSEEESSKAAKAIARLEQVKPEQVDGVLEEFHQFATTHQLFIKGGLEYAQKLLIETYGSSAAQRLIEHMVKSIGNDHANFENFRKVDPQQLGKFVQDEHPQTIALILSHLDPAQAAMLITSLPAETRTDVAIRMANLDQISPEIVRNIATVIDQKLRHLGEPSREACGGVKAVANMFNRLDPKTCLQLLDGVESDAPATFDEIRRYMFVFRDLEDLDTIAIKTIVSKVERNTLVMALKGSNDSLRKKFISSQSQRGGDMLAEDIASLGPVKLKDVDAAQQQIIAVARELEQDGVISLTNSPADQYVY